MLRDSFHKETRCNHRHELQLQQHLLVKKLVRLPGGTVGPDILQHERQEATPNGWFMTVGGLFEGGRKVNK